jgi:hypothetical protein
MLPLSVPFLHRTRLICRSAAVGVTVAALGAALLAQSPIQERVVGRRIQVPPIAERIEIRPIEHEVGSFQGLKPQPPNRISGIVITDLGDVLPNAGTVIIRSLTSGQAVATAIVDGQGQFAVREVEPGVYTAVLVNDGGDILTSSAAFTVGVDQLVRITAVVPRRSPRGFAHYLTSATTAAVLAAVGAGILTVAPPPPTSPE